MSTSVKIIKASIAHGTKLVTFQLRYPRFIHSQLMTHRAFSRNASSSRAIPVARVIEDIIKDPVYPTFWGKNCKGMSAHEELDNTEGVMLWGQAKSAAIMYAELLSNVGYHKEIVSRILEPFSHINVILTATDFDNFFKLRLSDAQPEMMELAQAMHREYNNVVPEEKADYQWHLPYVSEGEYEILGMEVARKLSVARCARVSYMRHDGTPAPIEEDIALHDRLLENGHLSPFEHQATPINEKGHRDANFQDWIQYRSLL